MNRRQLSQQINALTAQIEEKQKELDSLVDDLTRKKVDHLVDLVAEREKLRGELAHKTRTMQQRGMLL